MSTRRQLTPISRERELYFNIPTDWELGTKSAHGFSDVFLYNYLLSYLHLQVIVNVQFTPRFALALMAAIDFEFRGC